MSRTLPLNALRAFEFAARTGSFVEAGAQMGVSSAAVSQHVRTLEAYWGKKLFLRQGNRISLTEAGIYAYPVLANAFEAIADLSEIMQEKATGRRWVLSVPASLAETWAIDRIAQLRGMALEVRVDEDPVSFSRGSVDLRVFYGHGLYGEYRVENLFQDRVIALAAPAFVAGYLSNCETLSDLDDRFFIHTSWGERYASTPNWADWLSKKHPGRTLNPGRGVLVGQSSLALNLAKARMGVALVPRKMAARSLADGSVVQIGTDSDLMPHQYMLALPHALARREDVQRIVAALKADPALNSVKIERDML